MLRCQSAALNVCVFGKRTFNWRLKLSDSLWVSCQSKTQSSRWRFAALCTTNNISNLCKSAISKLWRTTREKWDIWNDGDGFTANCGALRKVHTGQIRHAGQAAYFGRGEMLHSIQAPGKSNYQSRGRVGETERGQSSKSDLGMMVRWVKGKWELLFWNESASWEA